MTGKEKCQLLKQIRKEIADRNGIAFEPAKCDYTGYCTGTCPKCDEEIRFLDAQINKKVQLGGKVYVAGVKLRDYDLISDSKPENGRNGYRFNEDTINWGDGRFGDERRRNGSVYHTMGLIRGPENIYVDDDEE